MLNRRDFIRSTSLTAALAATGQLPLWSAENELSYAAEGFARFLKSYKPPDTSASRRQFNYTLVNMGKQYGRLTTTIKGPEKFACEYSIKPGSDCDAEFIANGDLLSGLSSWKLASRTDPISKNMVDLCVYTETGEVSNDSIVVKVGGKTTSVFKSDLPLLPDWLLPLAVPILQARQEAFSFSLLREGSYFLGGQCLLYDGTASIFVKGGRKLELSNYLHLGEGTLPTNYLIDRNGVTVIVTHGLTAEVMS